MGGEKLPELRATGALPTMRIVLAILISAALHLMLLWIPPIYGGDVMWLVSPGNDSSRVDGLIKLDLVHGVVSEMSTVQLPATRVPLVRNRMEKPSSKAGTGLVSAAKPDVSPKLLSEIDGAVENLGIKGKMILHLMVDASGEVQFSEVIYSELPEVVGQELRRRFTEARFQPAVRNGSMVDASLLLRVDVD